MVGMREGIGHCLDEGRDFIKGLRLAVADIETVERVLRDGGVSSLRHGGRLVVPPQAAFGATLIFEASSAI